MLEAILAATATSGLLVLARGQSRFDQIDADLVTRGDEDDDLPCPWCFGPTAAVDERCPNCQRRFG
ncbi:MAG TPA: hypothetical protein VM470_02265 [Acidimicrobiia bacterium]|nr:hypothetical protein [Acidimicrobiia bacterium]